MTTAVSSYTLAQLETDLQALLGDFQGTRFTTVQLTDAINFAIKVLCTKMGYTYTEVLVPQNGYGAGDTTVGWPPWAFFSLIGTQVGGMAYNYTDYIEIRRVMFGFGSSNLIWTNPPNFSMADIPLNKTTMAQEDVNNPGWRNKQGVPQRWDFYDGQRITVFPLPISLSLLMGYLTIGYVQQPPLLSLSADTVDPRIPYRVQQYLKYAGASWLMSLDESDATALQTAKMYMDTFNALVEG